MALSISVTTDANRLTRALAKAPGGVKRETEKTIIGTFYRGHGMIIDAYSGRVLKRRTGQLANSTIVGFNRRGMETRAAIHTPTVYAVSHEVDTVITPGKSAGRQYVRGRSRTGKLYRGTSKGTKLTIPLPALDMYTRENRVARKRWIDHAILRLVGSGPFYSKVSKSGKAIVLYRPGKDPMPVAALKDEHVTKGHGIWRRTGRWIREELETELPRALNRAFRWGGFARGRRA